MKKILFIIGLVILSLCWQPAQAKQDGTLSLSIEDCIIKAMRHNLKVQVEVFNPELADTSLVQAKEKFLPGFALTLGSRRNENPSYWWIQGADTVRSDYRNYSFSVSQEIPTGGNFSISLNSYKSDTNEAFQLINPRYGSTLQFDFSQPLLKDFGSKISRKEILIAQNNLDISRQQFRSILMDTIYLVQEGYWNLVYAIEDHKVKQQSLQLARDLLTKNRKEVEVGKIAPIEILNAEAVVAQREADILQAETLIRKREDWLRNLLNITPEKDIVTQTIAPGDEPVFNKEIITFESALALSLQHRPDLKIYAKNVETSNLSLSVAKNQTLPGLSLDFSYWSPGVSGDRVLYLDNNPFSGVIVGKQTGSAGDSIADAFNQIYKNWSIGLTLTVPLRNFITKANLVKAKLELGKSLKEEEDNYKSVVLLVKDAVRDIETNSKRVDAYRVSRELAKKRLDAEERKLNVGLTTNYFVLQYQEELANARSMEIKALIDYTLAIAKLEQTVGISLQKRNIKITDF